jgi:hypothetical protein
MGLSSANGVAPSFLGTDGVFVSLVVMFFSLLSIFVISHFSPDSIGGIVVHKNLFLSISSILCGTAIFLDGIKHLFVGKSESFPGLLFVVLIIFAFISGLSIAGFGVFLFGGKNFLDSFPYLGVLPALWAFLRLYECNLKVKDDAGLTVEVYDILCFSLLAFFFFYQGKILANIGAGKSRSKELVMVYGMSSFLCSLFFLCDKIFKRVAENSFKVEDFFTFFTDASILLYIIGFLIFLSFSRLNQLKFRDKF